MTIHWHASMYRNWINIHFCVTTQLCYKTAWIAFFQFELNLLLYLTALLCYHIHKLLRFLQSIKLPSLLHFHLCYTRTSILPFQERIQWQKQFCRCILLHECFANGHRNVGLQTIPFWVPTQKVQST